MTMMTIAICDDMQADARKLHKQLERIVPGSEIRIFKSGELLLEELEKMCIRDRLWIVSVQPVLQACLS